MTLQINKFLNKIDKKEKILLIIFAFVPISYLIGNLFINLIFVLTAIIFIYEILSTYPHKKNISPIFWIFLFFFMTLIINIFFSIDPLNSLRFVLANLKKDKIKLKNNFYVFTGSSVGVVPILGKGLYTGKIEKLGSVKAKIV